MMIPDQDIQANTLAKLRLLEKRYAEAAVEPATDPHTRQLSLRSLKLIINQLREELILAKSANVAK